MQWLSAENVGHGSGCDLAVHLAAGPLDERGDQLAGILDADRWVLVQADAAAAARVVRPELGDRERGDRGLFGVTTRLAPRRTLSWTKRER